MSSQTFTSRLPVRAGLRPASRASAVRVAADRREGPARPERRATLAQVAEDVSPSVRGGFRLFAW